MAIKDLEHPARLASKGSRSSTLSLASKLHARSEVGLLGPVLNLYLWQRAQQKQKGIRLLGLELFHSEKTFAREKTGQRSKLFFRMGTDKITP